MVMIALDSHKHYSLANVQTPQGETLAECRIPHQRGKIREFLEGWEKDSPVAVESIGSWYWIVDEIEAAGMCPRLVNARKAKAMMDQRNKTDRLDAQGLNRLQRNYTLPTVWIAPGPLRDQRELPRVRMVFSAQRTRLKNRIHADIAKYGFQEEFGGYSDLFGKTARRFLKEHLALFPPQTAFTLELLLQALEEVEEKVGQLERQMQKVFAPNASISLLQTLPGVGEILSVVIWLEVGEVGRFAGPASLPNYAGLVPTVHSSGGHYRYGHQPSDVNHYLQWAFSEAANSVALNSKVHPKRHVSRLYRKIRQRKGHPIAIGAVARHLAEATYWMLTRNQPYREPHAPEVSAGKHQREQVMSL